MPMTEARQPEVRRRTGLSEADARRLLAAAGERSPAPAGRSYRNIVLANTLTLFNLILLVFFVVVVAAGRPADGLFAFIVVANSALGITQEIRAKRALETAALLVAPRARVIRDGSEREVQVEEVVDGDLISLHTGDQVVADGMVVESTSLMLDESPLTGESVAVEREVDDRLLSGSFVVEGGGRFVADSTGAESYAAKISGTAREHRAQRSPLELQINQLLKVLVGVMIPLGAAFVYVLIRHHLPFRDAAGVATAGIVTLVPEGLILLTSMTFAAAAVRLTRQGMLVQYLNSVESLANVDTVCLDKTGTLTDGALTLHSVIAAEGQADATIRELLDGFSKSVTARNATIEAIADAAPQAEAWDPRAAGAVLLPLEVERGRARHRRRLAGAGRPKCARDPARSRRRARAARPPGARVRTRGARARPNRGLHDPGESRCSPRLCWKSGCGPRLPRRSHFSSSRASLSRCSLATHR